MDENLIDLDDAEAIPATDPEPGMTLAEMFIQQYVPISVVLTEGTRDPRTLITMRQKAADIALQLTQNIIYRSERRAEA